MGIFSRVFLPVALASALPLHALAEEFPEGATALQPAELSQRLAGKVFVAKMKDGATWRFEYNSSGYFFFNHSRGPSDNGEWKIEESKLCMKGRNLITAACNEMRLKDGALLLKRDNGDVIQFIQN